MDLKPHASVSEFFYDLVTSAIKNQGLEASEPTECYLVNLLAEHLTTPVHGDEPLALKLAAAHTALPDERVRALKEVGDTSLYVSGFFSDSLQRRLLDVSYYVQIGATAYGQLAAHFRTRAVFGEVYGELGRKFPRFVDVLTEISEQSALTSPGGVVQLYERWRRTGSEWTERRLREAGLLPNKLGEA